MMDTVQKPSNYKKHVKSTVFCNVTLCYLAEVYEPSTEMYCLHHQERRIIYLYGGHHIASHLRQQQMCTHCHKNFKSHTHEFTI
jgi:hypothetical protein